MAKVQNQRLKLQKRLLILNRDWKAKRAGRYLNGYIMHNCYELQGVY